MKMKQLFRYTFMIILRTALLLGAIAFIIPTQAQTAGLPDAFETMDPATIIGDGNYYYIQFYDGNMRSYLTDCGVNVNAESKDLLPYANNRLWTLLPAGDGNGAHFYLKNKDGHYLYFESGAGARVKCTDNPTAASILQLTSLGDGYYLSSVTDGKPMYRNGNDEWVYLPCNANYYGSRVGWYRLRFVKLKSNSAFIIYYRWEGTDNSDPSSSTTRHYLTYSGTAASSLGQNWWQSDVSSQQSIIPADKPLPSLPTLAAYHKDGLWTIEEADVNGQFYIKKYGTNLYLNEHNHSGVYDCALESKDDTKGTYTLEEPLSNRYTRIQNVKYETTNLTADMFKTWDGYGGNATSTGNATVDFKVGTNEEIAGGNTIAGTGNVAHLTYANLSEYSKMTINGTQGMQLRVLLDRQESDNGPYVEKNVTIGSDGTAVIDLTDLEINRRYSWPTVKMTYVDANDAATPKGVIEWENPAKSGYNKISGGAVGLANSEWPANYITYLQVDASAIQGTILKATLKAKVSGSLDDKRKTRWGVGYNSSEWSSGLTWNNANKSITLVGDIKWVNSTTNSETYEDIDFDITQALSTDADKILTFLVYELEAGGGNFKEPVVEIQYEPTVKEKIPYAHLNAIKRDYGGVTGTINSISLSKISNTSSRYLHHADGDGWQVLQWSGDDAKYWYAGFYPVEVVDKDEYYKVLLKSGDQIVGVSSDQTALKTYNDFNPELWTLEQDEDYQDFTLQSWNGKYYNGDGIGHSLTTTPTEISNSHIIDTFSTIEWVRYIPYETRIMHNVTHKVSNVKLYYSFNETTQGEQKVLSQQGLITDDIDEWWDSDSGTQKVNEFKITHFVKKGDVVTYGLPTVLTVNNDHRLYQRWYKYGDDTNLEDLKNHFRLKVNNQEVMSYLYNNGIVTGQKLDWETIYPGALTFELNKLSYYNCDGEQFTLAADVSRYSDFTYKNESSHLDGDLEEPSLTMRYIYEMHDAKDMARELTTCTGNKWYEKEKIIHFPATRLKYESGKADEFKGEFIGIKHVFRDYWVFNGSGTSDDDLVSAVTNNSSGKIEVILVDGGTGITLGGYNNLGYYYYHERETYSYGDSRFVAFKYPESGTVAKTGEDHPAYLRVYFNNNGTRYQIATFKLIFDNNSATLPWTSVDGSLQVKGTDRDPKNLVEKAGKPIAKITFDYPDRITLADGLPSTFKNSSPYTIHNKNVMEEWWSRIENSSPIPLTFDNTNYGFDGDDPSWGSYAMVSTMVTRNGRNKTAMPVNDADYGYNISPDEGMKSAFFYVDASEQPGDICSIPFRGEFCSNDLLMCSGWISGSNRLGADQSPGSVTITVKGERYDGDELVTDDIYRFCPGQCYELDNGTGVDGSTNANYVVWQQFYFEFNISTNYIKQWVEVNNNCVSSMGGDFMLDNIEVYAMAPELEPEMNTPLCVNNSASELQLLKMSVGFDKLIKASGVNTTVNDPQSKYHKFGVVFLKKDVFLKTFQSGLSTYNGITISLSDLEKNIKDGTYKEISTTYKTAYEAAFDAALLGSQDIWNSNSSNAIEGAGLLNYEWSHIFEDQETYSFVKAVNGLKPIFGYTETGTGERFLIMNGNSPKLPWELNTVYYIVTNNSGISSVGDRFSTFNICSDCTKATEFQLTPPYKILSMETSNKTQELEVCEGKIPTLLTDLRGYNYNGVEVPLTNLNFDWWLGDLSATPKVPATLENYHSQQKTIDGETVRLDMALSYLRVYYPGITSLDGVIAQTSETPHLTAPMIKYLQELVDKGQLVLHQKSISFPVVKVSDNDPYFYLVACPIHDGYFDQALNHNKANDVAYFCEEPQGLRMKVGEKAPTLKTGFVPGENGFDSYAYPTDSDPLLSIRLAKKAQFETVRHGTKTDNPADTYNTTASTDKHFLWLPIRDAKVQSSGSTKASRSDDYNIYLASTNDPVWDQEIYTEMSKAVSSLPIVGKIVQLNAINTGVSGNVAQQNSQNRLCIYFTSNFEVREGYSYTLSLPFKEDGTNTCDGTILINMKIVPDYEVWTGAAGNTDWNNDENWRRADGNTANSGLNQDELYVGAATTSSPLKGYTTNADNYRTAKDRVFRKGFAPLYCTHVLMKNDEWGNAPVLYDALDGKNSLTASPFPNLRDEDNWDGQGAEATATPILRYDMQARLYDIWSETYGSAPASNKGRSGDLLAEMYQVNSCDEIAFQPGTELRNAHLLNYNTAWVEYELDSKRWYLLGSPLQGTISGEWYTPTGTSVTNNAPQQKTTYYDPVKFDATKYDRYNPAIYQRSWDKAKAVLYEMGSIYSTNDNPNDLLLDDDGSLPGYEQQGQWSTTWSYTGADEYLDRLGYKPFGEKKANVAVKGIWSNTYNDATVDYTKGGFSVMVMNHLKGKPSDVKAIIRLPKEDIMYDYWSFDQNNHGTNTDLESVRDDLERNLNRGRLKTDLLLPTSTQKTEDTDGKFGDLRYGEERTITRVPIKEDALNTMLISIRNHQETVSAGASNLGYYLVENPFPCGLDMNAFFVANPGLQKKYWLLTTAAEGQSPRQQLVQQAPSGEWISSSGSSFATADAVLAPGQGFFVQISTAATWDFTNAIVAAQAVAISQTSNDCTVKANEDNGILLIVEANGNKIRYNTNSTQMQNGVVVKVPVVSTNDVVTVTGYSDPNYSHYSINGVGNVSPVTIYTATSTDVERGYVVIASTDDNNYFVSIAVAQKPSTTSLTCQVTTIKYNKDMQAQSRFGVASGVRTFNVVVGQKQKMKKIDQIITLDDNTTITEEVEVPVTDDAGNYVLEDIKEDVVVYNYVPTSDASKQYSLKTRSDDFPDCLSGLVITALRDDYESSALVMQYEGASNDFLPSEDTETFITSELEQVPTVYTLCGRLATTINSIRDFRSLSIGVESDSDAPCVLTFQGVELLGDSIAFYDAVKRKLTPLESGMQFTISGQTQNRYYLVRGLKLEEAAQETHLQIFTEGRKVKVIASTEEPIVIVRCFDTAGRLLYSASPKKPEYEFSLPGSGVYIIEAQTEKDRKTKKVMTK